MLSLRSLNGGAGGGGRVGFVGLDDSITPTQLIASLKIDVRGGSAPSAEFSQRGGSGSIYFENFSKTTRLLRYASATSSPTLDDEAFMSWPPGPRESLRTALNTDVLLQNVIVVSRDDARLELTLGGTLTLNNTQLGDLATVDIEAGAIVVDAASSISTNADGPGFLK